MKTYRIATIPGDGIGKEVVPAGRQVMEALAGSSRSFRFEFENFDWGGDYFREHGMMMPDNGLDAIRNKDAILFGSAGDPHMSSSRSTKGRTTASSHSNQPGTAKTSKSGMATTCIS